jgi:integrase
MKSGRVHRVPVSDAALAMLHERATPKLSDFVFPGNDWNRGMSLSAMHALLRKLNVNDASPHGFRSSFRTWAAEQTSAPSDIAEAVLAHRTQSKTELAYLRGDLFEKRRQLMSAWAAYCEPKEGKVIPLSQGAKR